MEYREVAMAVFGDYLVLRTPWYDNAAAATRSQSAVCHARHLSGRRREGTYGVRENHPRTLLNPPRDARAQVPVNLQAVVCDLTNGDDDDEVEFVNSKDGSSNKVRILENIRGRLLKYRCDSESVPNRRRTRPPKR